MPGPLYGNALSLVGAGAALMSLIVYQGVKMNRTTPRFAPAGGPETGVVPGAGPPLRVLLLGESTVAGVGAPSHEEGLAGSVAAMLAQETGRAVEWRAVGKNGVTVEMCLQSLVPLLEGDRADLVLIALGVNDVVLFRGVGRFSGDVRRLIAEVRARLGTDVPIVFSAVPPMGSFPAFPQPLRSLVRLRSWQMDCGLRDVVHAHASVYHAPLRFKGGRHYFCDDGYHPSPLGYAFWADLMRPVARRVVASHRLA